MKANWFIEERGFGMFLNSLIKGKDEIWEADILSIYPASLQIWVLFRNILAFLALSYFTICYCFNFSYIPIIGGLFLSYIPSWIWTHPKYSSPHAKLSGPSNTPRGEHRDQGLGSLGNWLQSFDWVGGKLVTYCTNWIGGSRWGARSAAWRCNRRVEKWSSTFLFLWRVLASE